MANPVRGISVPEWYGEPLKDRCSIQGWIKSVDSAAGLAQWNDERTAQLAYLSLRGKALQWALNQSYDDPDKWKAWAGAEGLKKALEVRYTRRQTISEICSLRETLVQGEKELVNDFYDRCCTVNFMIDNQQWDDVVLNEARDNENLVTQDKKSKQKHHRINVMNDFSHGLREEIKSLLLIQDPQTQSEMLSIALRVEASINDKNKAFQNNQLLQVQAIRGKPNFNNRSRFSKPNKENDRCHRCGQLGHWAPECDKPRNSNFRGRGRNQMNRGGRSNRPQNGYKSYEISDEREEQKKGVDGEKSVEGDFSQSAQVQAFEPSADIASLMDSLNPYRL